MRQRERKDVGPSRTTRCVAWTLVAALIYSSGCAAASSAMNPANPSAPPVPPPPTSAQAGNTTIVAVAPPAAPCCKKQTLPEFLGITQFGQAVIGAGNHVCSRLRRMLGIEGMFPELQAKPPILPITDPANMSEDAPPVVKAAAEAKQEEDQAAQKVQALRYLARIGCGGCYPNIEDALLSALDDCTEEVRYEAVLALRGKSGTQCTYCKSDRCCSEKVRKKLDEIANKTDDKGCHVEPSGRVRRLARMALDACGGSSTTQPASEVPTEGPDASAPPAGANSGGLAGRAKATQSVLATAHETVTDRSPESDASTAPLGLFEGVEWMAVLTGDADSESSAASDDGIVPVSATNDSVLAWVDRTAIRDSRISRLVEQRIARLKTQGIQLDPDAARRLMMSETYRAIDLHLLLQEMRKDQGSTPGRPTREEIEQLPEWLAARLKVDTYVSMFELTRHYEAQRERFRTPPQLRWERITVAKSKFTNRDDARTVMTYLRSRALGKETARPNFDRRAVETETHDWTKMEDMASPTLGRVLFQMPVGVMSSIIEDDEFLHTVRVLEKHAAGTVAFDEVADTLRQEIVTARQSEAERLFLAQLRADARIWTVYDDESSAKLLPSDRPAERSAERPRDPLLDQSYVLPPATQPSLTQPAIALPHVDRSRTIPATDIQPATNRAERIVPTGTLPRFMSAPAQPARPAHVMQAAPKVTRLQSTSSSPAGFTPSFTANSPSNPMNAAARPVRDLVTNMHRAGRVAIAGTGRPAPLANALPVAPATPVGSVAPVRPAAPVSPAAPVGAATSVGAAAPIDPRVPVGPLGPVVRTESGGADAALVPLPPIESVNDGVEVAESRRREAQ